MSLRNRLRLWIILLVVGISSAFLALNLYTVAGARFDELVERTQFAASHVESTLVRRLRERARALTPPDSLDATKRMWRQIVQTDSELEQSLRDTLAGSRTILEIQVVGEDGTVLSSSDPASIGARAVSYPSLAEWQALGRWKQLAEVFGERKNYEVSIPLGVSGQQQPVFQVKVILSTVLLRHTLEDQIRSLIYALVLSLACAVALAIVGSNLALRPLQRVKEAIDRIASGNLEAGTSESSEEPSEVALIESKLQMLGQQVQGATRGVNELRSNVEQLLERLGVAVLLFDRNQRLIMAGREAERLLGRGRWELLGAPLNEVFPASTPLGSALQTALALGQPLKDALVTIHEPGQGRTLKVYVDAETLESFPDKDRMGVLVTLRDAESRRELSSQIELSERLAAISRLTGGVAHEIKNPLNSITLHLEILRTQLEQADEDVQQELQVITQEISRLDRVVKTFLDFTRPVELKLDEIDAVELVRESITLVTPEAEARGVEVSFCPVPETLRIRADRDLIKQALLNVMVNGIEAMPDGGCLNVSVESLDRQCLIEIRDQGIGIPAEVKDRIFRLYFTTKPTGSGIGLAQTFRAVQLHGGTIDFNSEEGKGTTFRIKLPLA